MKQPTEYESKRENIEGLEHFISGSEEDYFTLSVQSQTATFMHSAHNHPHSSATSARYIIDAERNKRLLFGSVETWLQVVHPVVYDKGSSDIGMPLP